MLTTGISFPSGPIGPTSAMWFGSYALSVCKNTAHFERVNMRQPSCGLEVDIGF